MWSHLFIGFIVLQLVLVVLAWYLNADGKALGMEAAKRLDAMRPAFQSFTAIGVIACMMLIRAKLHPDVTKTPQDLIKFTLLALSIGELTLLIALIGLAKLHFGQFLVSAGLVFIVDFAMLRPACQKLLGQPAPKN